MKEYNPNGPSEMLNLLLDGEIDMIRESLLYKELATNTEIQSELKEVLGIRQAILKDVEAFTPPQAATAKIFSDLGYSSPPGLAESEDSSPGFWSKIFKRVVVPAAILLLAGIGSVLHFGNDAPSGIERALAPGSARGPIVTNNAAPAARTSRGELNTAGSNSGFSATRKIPGSTAGTAANSAPASAMNAMPAGSAGSNAADTYMKNNAAETTMPAPERNYLMLAALSTPGQANVYGSFAPRASARAEIMRSRNYFTMNKSLLTLGEESEFRRRFSLHVRGIYALSNPEKSLQWSGKNQIYTNFSLGGFLTVSENLSFGAEIGQEPFGQVFISQSDNPEEKYDQGPNVFWFGIASRYEFKGVSVIGINPYAQAFVGGSTLGPLVRCQGGLQVPVPGSKLAVTAGYEGSKLWYKNQNTWYSTNKHGLAIGLMFKF